MFLCCQGAQGKRKEVDGENTATAAGVRKRGDAVSYSLLAEVRLVSLKKDFEPKLLMQVNTFHEQRVKDIKSSHQVFLQEQIKFYQKVKDKSINILSVIIVEHH